MTRSELIQILATKEPMLSMKESEKVVKMILDYLMTSLSSGKRLEIRGFGSFSLRFRQSRIARNPKTGEQLNKASKFTPFFRPGKEMRARVNANREQYPLHKEVADASREEK